LLDYVKHLHVMEDQSGHDKLIIITILIMAKHLQSIPLF